MSEVSKKRIVSNENSIETSDVQLTSDSNGVSLNSKTDDISLQDIIEAEFNSRLSNIVDNEAHTQCMSPNNDTVENNIVDTSDIMTSSPSKTEHFEYSDQKPIAIEPIEVAADDKIKFDTIAFINNEKQFCVVSMAPNATPTEPEQSTPDQNQELVSPSVKINEENSIVKEVVDEDPLEISVNSESSDSQIRPEKPSIKDKLMLGNDEQMALLFSQTIRSPAFTPTDENFDIIQAIKREENSVDEFVKIENLCRDESFEIKHEEISTGDEEVLNHSTESSNGEISPEDEREISQGSDLSVTLGDDNNSFEVISTIKIQESAYETIHIIPNGVMTPDLVESCEDVIQEEDENELEEHESPIVETNGDHLMEHLVEPPVESPQVEPEPELEPENGIDDTDDSSIVKVSENAFLVNDKKSHECLTTNSAQLVLNLVNTTSTMETTTTVTETIENVTTNGNSIENKSQVKKKKSKKSKKDHEKENISVNDVNNKKEELCIEDDLSQVNVKNLKKNYYVQSLNGSNNIKRSEPIITTGVSIKELCRSFGDLTSLPDENNRSNLHTPVSPKRTSATKAKSMIDLHKLDSEPLYTGVSVKALRASFMNLATNSNAASSSNNSLFIWGERFRSRRPISAHPPLLRSRSVGHQETKSSFSKFDALSKKTVLHVRSSDAGKAQEKFNGSNQSEQNCKSCNRQVFQMEQIKAEKAIWHKNCFRCKECNKQLTVDTYQSHEGTVYCKPHFKALFAPKVVEDTQPQRPRKHELIIRESQPVELPPDVVRASDKPDLGLEELQSLNVKSRFQVFEQANEQHENNLERTPSNVNVKRSASILSKLAKFQSKGMDIGVTDDSLNGIPIEYSSDESEESDDGIEGEDADLIRAKRKTAQKEQPVHFDKLKDLKSQWETGNQMTREERREERKQEIQSIRSRLFMGKQGKMKEMYQQAVAESESGANVKKQVATEVSEQARLIKEKFEKGEISNEEVKKPTEEDMSVFDAGISKKSRSLFLELDANAGKTPQVAPLTPVKTSAEVKKAREAFTRHISEDVVKSSDCVDDVKIETADITNKFKFFETYKAPEAQRKPFRITPPREGVVKENSPEREIYRDPDIVRAEEIIEDPLEAAKTHTATKMLSLFRQMEEKSQETTPAGPKPLKCFTPPPEPQRDESESEEEDVTDDDEEESENENENPNIVRAADKPTDEFLINAQNAARAKQLRAKFERWEENELRKEQREQNSSAVNLAEECSEEQIETAKSLRARFESMRETSSQKVEKQSRVKVNRFVDVHTIAETCDVCHKRVYPLEKVECDSKMYHKQCFRCLQCNAILRMDSYTLNQGMLFCIPHFKQLFIAKGNYETGFGLDQHKSKWEQHYHQTNGVQTANATL